MSQEANLDLLEQPLRQPMAEVGQVAAAPALEHNAKCLQIFAGARQVFMADGFDGASMNDVARAAGVSKGTLYVYFDSKEALFEALIRHDRTRQAEQLCQFDAGDHDVGAVLLRFGTKLFETMAQPEHIAHFRTVMAVVPKFPGIGRAFYEAGPRVAVGRLSNYLAAQVKSGVLVIDDTEYAAQQFLELCKAGFHLKLILGVIDQPERAEIESRVARAVSAFLKIHAALPDKLA